MALPPKGDPRRPMHLAIRSCRGLGLLFGIIGALVGLSIVLFSRQSASAAAGAAVAFLLVMLPGALYVITAIFMKRRQPWAVILGLVISSLQGLFALLAFAGSLIDFSAVGMVISLLWVLAMAQLIYQLSQSPRAMRADLQYQPRGFEVIPTSVQIKEDQADI